MGQAHLVETGIAELGLAVVYDMEWGRVLCHKVTKGLCELLRGVVLMLPRGRRWRGRLSGNA